MQKIRNNDSEKLAIDFKDNTSFIMLCAFSNAYLPACNTIVSLVNLPIRKAGIIYFAFNFAMPAPKNSGVVGSGNKE